MADKRLQYLESIAAACPELALQTARSIDPGRTMTCSWSTTNCSFASQNSHRASPRCVASRPFRTSSARRWTTRQFVPFLENADHFAFANVLRHGDFGTSNILYSAGQQRVMGIIDFGRRRRRRPRDKLCRAVHLLRRTVPEALRTRLSPHRSLLGTHPLLCRLRLPAGGCPVLR